MLRKCRQKEGQKMGEYEVRILNPDGSLARVHAEVQLNDAAAIHSARRLAKGAAFDVWRGVGADLFGGFPKRLIRTGTTTMGGWNFPMAKSPARART